MTLDQLVAQLRSAHGSALRAVVLYGSAATADFVKDQSDYNVLVVADSLEVEHLRAAGAVTRAWMEGGQPAPLLLTTSEWKGSADIFPMEYADILDRHRVLAGELPLDGVRVDTKNLRLQLEYQAMGKLLALRQGVLTTSGDGKRQVELLAASRSAILVVFRAVERLQGKAPATDAGELVRSVAAAAGFDASPFERVVAQARGESKISSDESGEILARYVRGMEALVGWLDRYEGA